MLDPDLGPVALQKKVQFDIRYFCRRGCENIYDMKKDTFELHYNSDTGMAYVYKARDEKQKNHIETNNPIITGFIPSILDPTTGQPHKMCPVRSFESYSGSLNPQCEYLWQTPNMAGYTKGTGYHYKKIRVGENKLAAFMTDWSHEAKLSRVYTSHCIRVTGATNLTRAKFSPHQIMSITGHKSVNSLAIYQRVAEDEKMMMGMSLAYNLFKPEEVSRMLQKDEKVADITPPQLDTALVKVYVPQQPQEASTSVKKDDTTFPTINIEDVERLQGVVTKKMILTYQMLSLCPYLILIWLLYSKICLMRH